MAHIGIMEENMETPIWGFGFRPTARRTFGDTSEAGAVWLAGASQKREHSGHP